MQLPLKLSLRDDAIFDNFFIGNNVATLHALKQFCFHRKENFIFCYGETGVGKTHLLQACCHALNAAHNIFYVSLKEFDLLAPSIFESLENQSVVCIDDVDCIVGKQPWEEALFYFYNRARAQETALLISAKKPPQYTRFILKDLQSRLSAGLICEIKNLSDAEKIQALQHRAKLRGLILNDSVADYLMHHQSRDMHHLVSALDKLDQMSLIEKKRLSISLVKKALYRG